MRSRVGDSGPGTVFRGVHARVNGLGDATAIGHRFRNGSFRIPFALCLLAASVGSATRASDFPLRHLAVRDARDLAVWQFRADPQDQGIDEGWADPGHRESRADWAEVRIPAVWDRPPGEVTYPIPRQVGWYRTTAPVPDTWDGEVALAFLGSKYITDVFANGEYLGIHRGGYTPFLFDITPHVRPGSEVEILVRVDNRLPPDGVPKANTGWGIYGGLTREVYLLHRPPVRLENLHVTTDPGDDGSWTVRVRAEAPEDVSEPFAARLFAERRPVASAEGDAADGVLDLELRLEQPRLWSPDNPFLHMLELTWGEERIALPVGIREIRVKGDRILLNGEPVWLQGFGHHESWPRSGPILSFAQRRQDLEAMKEDFGANAVRLGHYPHHPDVFRLCDEIGLLVFTEMPVWQIPAAILHRQEVWESWLDPQITAMAVHLRNHPSVFAWGVFNETWGARAYLIRARDRFREIDPSRPVAAVMDAIKEPWVYGATDFGARNLHYGWYHSPSVYSLREGLARNLEAAEGRPLWVAEMGGRAQPGRLQGGYRDDLRGTEFYQDKTTRFALQYLMSHAPAVSGVSVWTWSDYTRGDRPELHGMLSNAREPKLVTTTAANLMRPEVAVLAVEDDMVVPVGGTYRARIHLFHPRGRPEGPVEVVWRIHRGEAVVADGRIEGEASDGWTTDLGRVDWEVTDAVRRGLHHLLLELRDGDGGRLHTQAVPIEPGPPARPGVLRLAPPPDGRPHWVEVAGMPLRAWPGVGLHIALPRGPVELRTEDWTTTVDIEPARATVVAWPDY